MGGICIDSEYRIFKQFSRNNELLTHSKIIDRHHIVCVLNSNSNMLRWHDGDKRNVAKAAQPVVMGDHSNMSLIEKKASTGQLTLTSSRPQLGSLQCPIYSAHTRSQVSVCDVF